MRQMQLAADASIDPKSDSFSQKEMDELAGLIRSSVQEESALRLAEFDKAVNGQP
jgi:hypothetical protein